MADPGTPAGGGELRDAATLALLRTSGSELQVLLLGRPASASFAPRTQVFPGGSVDMSDRDPRWRLLLDRQAERDWDVRAGLAVRVAAIRETYEECGILLAGDSQGQLCNAQQLAELEPTRSRLRHGEPALLLSALASFQLRPAVDEIAFCAHWVTPEGLPRRFDTRFFVAASPAGQEPSGDALGEHVSLRWVAPAQALAEGLRGDCQLLPPTRAVLAWLARSTCVEDVLERARRDLVDTMRPRLEDVTSASYPGLDLSTLHGD